MNTLIKLDANEGGKNIDIKAYRNMIRALLYLMTSRPNTIFSVCMCARFQANPKESHLNAIKRILRYFKGTLNIGFYYPKGSFFELRAFSDIDFEGYKIYKKKY